MAKQEMGQDREKSPTELSAERYIGVEKIMKEIQKQYGIDAMDLKHYMDFCDEGVPLLANFTEQHLPPKVFKAHVNPTNEGNHIKMYRDVEKKIEKNCKNIDETEKLKALIQLVRAKRSEIESTETLMSPNNYNDQTPEEHDETVEINERFARMCEEAEGI